MSSIENSELGPRLQREFDRFNAILEDHLNDLQQAEIAQDEARRVNAIGGMAVGFFNFVNDIDVISGTPAIQDYSHQGTAQARQFVRASKPSSEHAANRTFIGRLMHRFMAD